MVKFIREFIGVLKNMIIALVEFDYDKALEEMERRDNV